MSDIYWRMQAPSIYLELKRITWPELTLNVGNSAAHALITVLSNSDGRSPGQSVNLESPRVSFSFTRPHQTVKINTHYTVSLSVGHDTTLRRYCQWHKGRIRRNEAWLWLTISDYAPSVILQTIKRLIKDRRLFRSIRSQLWRIPAESIEWRNSVRPYCVFDIPMTSKIFRNVCRVTQVFRSVCAYKVFKCLSISAIRF